MLTNHGNELRFSHVVGGLECHFGAGFRFCVHPLFQFRASFPRTANQQTIHIAQIGNDFVVEMIQFCDMFTFTSVI